MICLAYYRCLTDFLEIATIDLYGRRTFRGRFCGGILPGPLLLLQPTVELKFSSNHAVHRSGFTATYEFVDEGCDMKKIRFPINEFKES